MNKFQIGDYVIVNKKGCFSKSCAEYHAVVIGDYDGSCYRLQIIDDEVRPEDCHYGIASEFRCSERYMAPDFDMTFSEVDNLINISSLI